MAKPQTPPSEPPQTPPSEPPQTPPDPLGELLRKLKLEKHLTDFRDNGIDMDVLHDLTEAELEKLDLKVGDRKRLIKAIAKSPEGTEKSPEETLSELGLRRRRGVT
jgi:hypothetical protein